MAVSVIVFDLGKVIFDFDLSKFITAYTKKISGSCIGSIDELIRKHLGIASSFEKGIVSPKQFYETLSQETHYTGSYNEFCVIWNNIFKPMPETIEILAKLAGGKAEKYKLAVLSNTNILHFEFLNENYPGIFTLFDKLFLSYELNLIKPEHEIFGKVIDYFKVRPEEIFFIDDIEKNVEAARICGIKAYKFEGALKLIEHLKAENVEI